MQHHRPRGLIAIVVYKAFVAILFTATSIGLLLVLKNYQQFVNFVEPLTLDSNQRIIVWFLNKVLNLSPGTLKFSGIAAGVYALLTAIEGLGLWFEKAWAHILVIGLVSISIFPEVYELIQGLSLLKLLVFAINMAVFWYLLRHFPKPRRRL